MQRKTIKTTSNNTSQSPLNALQQNDIKNEKQFSIFFRDLASKETKTYSIDATASTPFNSVKEQFIQRANLLGLTSQFSKAHLFFSLQDTTLEHDTNKSIKDYGINPDDTITVKLVAGPGWPNKL